MCVASSHGAGKVPRHRCSTLLSSAAAGLLVRGLVLELRQHRDAASVVQGLSAEETVAVGLAALDAFLQANVTGPVLDDGECASIERHFLSAWTQNSGPKAASASLMTSIRRSCLDQLVVDGVAPYAHIPHLELFSLARYIFNNALGASGGLVVVSATPREAPGDVPAVKHSLLWMRLRVLVWHYKLLTQPSLGPGSNFTRSSQWSDVPTLAENITSAIRACKLQILSDDVWDLADDSWSKEDKTLFLLEASNAYILLGSGELAREALKEAARVSGFAYALSGALGKRTRFQEKDISQLVVLAKSDCAEQQRQEEDGREHGAAIEQTPGATAKPEALQLNDDTLLEDIAFATGGDAALLEGQWRNRLPAALADLPADQQPQLAPLDQLILLTEATMRDVFWPSDSLTAEEVLPFALRVLNDKSTNWQIYTQALLVRSRIEVHRSRTLERGVLQLQAVADQVLTDTTTAARQLQRAQDDQEGGEDDQEGGEDDQEKKQKQQKETDAAPIIQVVSPPEDGRAASTAKPTSFLPAPKPSESAPADVRLRYVHALSSPPRWHLESELAYAWAGVGSLTSALEIFKRLRLWAEVALCLASSAAAGDEDGRGAGGEEKAKGIVRWRLFHRTRTTGHTAAAAITDQNDKPEATEENREQHEEEQHEEEQHEEEKDEDIGEPTLLKAFEFCGPERRPPPPNAPRLWCILGDLEDEPSHYERAWDLSQQRYARAQRSLGEYCLKAKDLEGAQAAYKKATAVNRLSPDMWSRLGDISLRLARFDDAADAYGRAIASATDAAGGEDARTWSNLGSALWSLYREATATAAAEDATRREGEDDDSQRPKANAHEDEPEAAAVKEKEEMEVELQMKEGREDEEGEERRAAHRADPATLLSKALAAYKKGASLAHSNWRIWDNVLTLASRVQPPAVPDMVLAFKRVLSIRKSEDAVDLATLSTLLQAAVLSRDKPRDAEQDGSAVVYEPPRGSDARLVNRLVEEEVVPLITRRSELWALVSRLRAWRRDYTGALDAAERAWRAATGGSSSGLLPGSRETSSSPSYQDESDDGDWTMTSNARAWHDVVQRTDELVSALENWGPEGRWRAKARGAVRSVMARGRESWEGRDGWETLESLLDGLKFTVP